MEKTVFDGGRESLAAYIRRVYRARRLIFTLARRDLKGQYAQTVLGLLWAAIQPLTGLLIFTLFFHYLIKVDTGNIPYPLFAFSGMISWNLFSWLLRQTGFSLSSNLDLISKLSFPKLILPLSKVVGGMVEMGISLGIIVVMMVVTGVLPGWQIVLFPAFLVMNVITGLSVGIWLAALTVRYRDFQHIIPYLTNFGIWLTPVFYPTTLLPEQFDYLLYFNPMAGVVEGFRWSLLGGEAPSIWYAISFVGVIILLVSGLFYFKKVERDAVDIV